MWGVLGQSFTSPPPPVNSSDIFLFTPPHHNQFLTMKIDNLSKITFLSAPPQQILDLIKFQNLSKIISF